MNKQPIIITRPINLAHIMSLSGMLREYAPKNIHSIFSLQVFHQAEMQNMGLGDLTADDYDILLTKTMNFSIPTGCIADVGNVLMEVCKKGDKTLSAAVDILIGYWTPFVSAAMKAHNIKPDVNNRITDYPPESLN